MKSNAFALEALRAVIPCLRGKPEFSAELCMVARVLIEHGVNHVCNGWLMDDLTAEWTTLDQARQRTYLLVTVGTKGGREKVLSIKENLAGASGFFDAEFASGRHRKLELYADYIAPYNLCGAMSAKEQAS